MELSYNQLKQLLYRYPKFDHCYETVSQKGNLKPYDYCIGIPTGKRHIVWNTFYNDKDVSYLMDLNKEKQISKATILKKYGINTMSQNTIVFGTIVEDEEFDKKVFLIDDIYYFKGVNIKNATFYSKLNYIKEYIIYMNQFEHDYLFAFPCIWKHEKKENEYNLPYFIHENIINNIGYEIHHIQYRSLEQIVPYINVYNNKRWELNNKKVPTQLPISSLENTLLTRYKMIYSIDWNKPQYKYTTNFLIKADLQNDIYHLFAYGSKKQIVYYNVAFIPDYKTSVMMNEIFRNIRENKNIDYIEESEDEDDFENVSIDKHVNIYKTVPFECIYSRKFKKWIPLSKIKEDNKIVHIGRLVRDYMR